MDGRAKLKAFLEDNSIKPGSFARSIGYDRANFHRLLKRSDAKPSLELAALIERETRGEVPAAAWAQAA